MQNNGDGDKHVDKHADKQTEDAKKNQESLHYCDDFLTIANMNLSLLFLQHNTNMAMAMTKQTNKPHIG